MTNVSHFLYFINLVKDTLSVENYEEFTYKIKTSFDFRLKVQKFVYIAKYFGWNHSYNYSLYIRGPYSSALADDYYDKDLLTYSPSRIETFDSISFNSFVKEKPINYLESASTILYFMNAQKNFSKTDALNKLEEIKPYIDSQIVEKSYDDINNLNLEDNDVFYESIIIKEDLDIEKEILIGKIEYYMDFFTDFGRCNNSILVSGSLDYLRLVLINENLGLEMKSDLIKLLSKYVLNVEIIYDLCGGNGEVFKYLNLDYLENNFDRIQDYVNEELNIFPKLDDGDFEEIVYGSNKFKV